MNTVPRKDLAIMVVGTTISVICVAVYSKISRSEAKKRQEIRRQGQLDLKALGIAAELVHERMNDPEYLHLGIANVMNDFNNEIAFQKIAVREDV